jgi:hypothetical protein
MEVILSVTSALTRRFAPPKYRPRQVLFPNHARIVLHVRPSRWAGSWAARVICQELFWGYLSCVIVKSRGDVCEDKYQI